MCICLALRPRQNRPHQATIVSRCCPRDPNVEDIRSEVAERPDRDVLLQPARRRELDAIVVWRLDRWGRSLVDLTATLSELSALGVGFVSLTEAIDLTTPTGRALAGMTDKNFSTHRCRVLYSCLLPCLKTSNT